jgi:FtsP/CotA-like multicopper oxidase with cupredoxin domain
MISRRNILVSGAAGIAAGSLLKKISAADETVPATQPATAPAGYTPVITPNGSTLPFVRQGDVKVFHLIAEEVKREFAPGMMVNCWGYNGQTPGPTIEAVEGDRVRIYVTNKLPEPTSVHWHGMITPNGMDGVAGLTQAPIEPGQTFKYEFTLRDPATYMYHPHFDEMVQMAMGMSGFFIIHPREPAEPNVDRDFCLMLGEWRVDPGTFTPNPNIMTDFNMFTFNSRVWPGTAPLIIKKGDRVRFRIGNLSMDSHPIHFHGHHLTFTATDAGPIPPSARHRENTINVPPGTTRDVEFLADNPGDWPLHCHKTHHAMNAMSHDIPNLLGVNPKGLDDKIRSLLPGYMPMGHDGMGMMTEMHMKGPKNTLPMMAGDGQYGGIGMGGMFTVVKIREGLKNYDQDPGWYSPPLGTLAGPVDPGEIPKM